MIKIENPRLAMACGIIFLPGIRQRNMLCRMVKPVQEQATSPARMSKAKLIIIKVIVLTAISLGLGFTHNWASSRYYKPDYVAGFRTGLLEGALMPAALPGLVRGYDLPIYAPNNLGRPYKIGYILGLNTCGTVFFGVAFWQPRRFRQTGNAETK